MKNINFLVDIRCFTFQHANYIKDALDGFTMQQTSFPYIILMVDDASTDGEQEVIYHYLQEHFDLVNKDISWTRDAEDGVYTYAQHKTNKNCFIMALCLRKNLHAIKGAKMKLIAEWRDACKYEALCEGDDYWTDPLKLQKQVDYLEGHEDYSMCYTDYDTVDSQSQKFDWPNHEKNIARSFTGDNFRELLKGNYPQTMTILYRASVVQNPDYRGGIDYALSLGCALLGKCAFLVDKTACYRLHGDSAIHTATNYVHSASLQAWENYVDLYLTSNKYKRNTWEHMLICGTIDACLISKKRCGGVQKEQADRVLKNHPELKKYMWLGVLYRTRHTIMKRFK